MIDNKLEQKFSPEDISSNKEKETSNKLESIIEVTSNLINEAREDDLDKAINFEERLESVKDQETKEALIDLYSQITGYNQQIELELNDTINEVASVNEIPPHLLKLSLKSAKTESKEDLGIILEERHKQGEEKLEEFVNEGKKPFNLLYIDKNISKERLEKRIKLLDCFYDEYTNTPLKERNKMEETITRMFDIPTITKEAKEYLDEISNFEDTMHSEGAENKNLIYLGSELHPQVIKVSKERHDIDFSSILKLMRNMHAISLRLDHGTNGTDENDNVKTDISFRDMTIYKDEEGNYKRMVRQEYAPGSTIKDLPKEIKESNDFKKAWNNFLKKIEAMKETDQIVLDISDSDAGFKKERGDINNTGNVFVKLPTPEDKEYLFTVIDPDVFDSDLSKHKFDPLEYVRRKGFKGIFDALKITATNLARERIVSRWQDEYVKKELDF